MSTKLNILAENKHGYKLLEYLKIPENELENYNVTSAAVIYKVKDKYLFGYNNWRLEWEIPAGQIDDNETAKDAAIRELYEETHQKSDNLTFCGVVKKDRPKKGVGFMAIYTCEADAIAPFIKEENDENDKIKLWDLKEDIGEVDKVDKKIIELVSKYNT